MNPPSQLEQDGRSQHDGWYGRQLHDFTSKGDSAEHSHQFEGTTRRIQAGEKQVSYHANE